MSSISLSGMMLGYALLLFLIGFWAEKKSEKGQRWTSHPMAYALSMAVYCSGWTYFTSIGAAAKSGLLYLAIYLGPTVAYLFQPFLIEKLGRIKKALHITNVADLAATRYGKSPAVGALVTGLILTGTIPYVALQLRSIGNTFAVMTGRAYFDLSISERVTSQGIVVLAMALFIIVFGLRRVDASERHPGLTAVLNVDAIVKLFGLLAGGMFCYVEFYRGSAEIVNHLPINYLNRLSLFGEGTSAEVTTWVVHFVLSAFAINFLPRQFHVSVIENENMKQVRAATWVLPLYLILVTAFMLPVSLAGVAYYGNVVDSGVYLLSLPLDFGQRGLASYIFIGGFSASLVMVVAEVIAVSGMMTNYLIMPLVQKMKVPGLVRGNIFKLRWVSAVVFLLFSFVYGIALNAKYPLGQMGMISFAAVFQLAPLVLGGLFWKKGSKTGAIAGLSVGFLVWIYTLLLPSFQGEFAWVADLVTYGPFGIGGFRPEQLFYSSAGLIDSLSHGVFWSTAFNVGAYVLGSLMSPPVDQELVSFEWFFPESRGSKRKNFADSEHFFVDSNEKRLQVVNVLQRYLSEDDAIRVCKECFDLITGEQDSVAQLSVTLLADLYAEVERRLSGFVGTAAAHGILQSSGLITEAEKRALSEVYAELFAEMKVSPAELKERIDYQKRVEEILRNYMEELERKLAERDRENKELTKASRVAGMAEVATSVLHNVGNVLNSLNVSVTVVSDGMKSLKVERLEKLSQLIEAHRGDLGSFLTTDERGKVIPDYLKQLSEHYSTSSAHISQEIVLLEKNLEHVKRIIAMQQTYARQGGVEEKVDLREIIEDAIRINQLSLDQYGIKLIRNFSDLPLAMLDRHRVIQIIVNLISNARNAVRDKEGERTVTIHCEAFESKKFVVEVGDNGVGIAPENINKIFQHGFTTRREGHGFGLHSGAIAAKEMGGGLKVVSAGLGLGAVFVLELPLK